MFSLVLDIATTASILFSVAAGLLVVLGVLKIVNFAHGAFLVIGAYSALVVTWLGLNPWFAYPVAFFFGGDYRRRHRTAGGSTNIQPPP